MKEAQGRARGSSAFKGAVDIELEVKSEGEKDNFYITLSQSKNKDDELQEDLRFKRVGVALDGVFERSGKQVWTAVLERQAAQEAAPLVIKKAADLKITARQKLALETYIKAAQYAGLFVKYAMTFYGVRLEDWRTEFYKRSSAEEVEAKRQAFHRARCSLIEKLGILSVENGGESKKGDICKPVNYDKFMDYIEAAELTSEYYQVEPTSKSEMI